MNFPKNPGLHALALAVLAAERHPAQRKDRRELDAFCKRKPTETPVPCTHVLERFRLVLEKFLEVLRIGTDDLAERSLFEELFRFVQKHHRRATQAEWRRMRYWFGPRGGSC